MTTKDRDGFPVLFYVTDPEVETATGLREATAQDLVAALIAEGGEIVEAPFVDGPLDQDKGVKSIRVEQPGRYLVFPIPAEDSRDTGEKP